MSAAAVGAGGIAGASAADAPPTAMASVNAREHGAKGDGTTDDTKALQAALQAASTQGPICFLPPGLYRIEGSLTVPAGVTLCGASGGVPHSEHPIGSVILATGGRGEENGTPLLTLKPNAVLRNITIHYPDQKLPDVAAYPWTVRLDGELCQVRDVTLTNPYQGIDAGTKWNELHLIQNVFGCPLKTGIYIDQCTDIGRIENVHFNPNFWTRMGLKPGFAGGDLPKYLAENLTGFKIGKTDWEFITNCFVIFPKYGYHFDDFGHGPGNAVVTQSGGDICPVAVRVDRTQPHAGVQFANGQFMSTFEIGPKNHGPVKLANCGFWGTPATKEHIRHEGPCLVSLTSCHFNGWGQADPAAPCVRASKGRLIVSGCDFMESKAAIRLEKGLTSAAIYGCAFRGDKAVLDESGADVQMGVNTTH